ncbi:response regulator [Lysinibacillus fusiformis]|uniref:response regulator n=1 Tax=Lysinibacillus fusiformis TaxID=28031 RepID=UPI003D058865
MRLKYEILWFEDNVSWFSTISDAINELLEEKGFKMIVHRYDNDSEGLFKILKESDCDLILMDYSLENQKGDEIIKSIRDLEIYTDIVFYSQSGAKFIRDLIRKQGIDGIFCSSRDFEEFEEKVNGVIGNTIKKVQDVNNMRGLVIAETIDLESKIADILKGYLSVIYENDIKKATILKNICDKKQEQFLKESELINVIHQKNINELIDENILTTYNLYTGLQSLLKSDIKELNVLLQSKPNQEERIEIEEKRELLLSIKERISNFEKEIILIRNTLAHVKELKDPNSGTSYLESVHRNGTKIIFDDNKYVEIRRNLVEYSECISELNEYFLNNAKLSDSIKTSK